MPKHLAMNANFLQGTAYFNNTRNVTVTFKNTEGVTIGFSKAPKIMLTPCESTSMPAFKQIYVKTGPLFTGVTIKMNSPWTGEMDWIMMEGA